MQSVCSAPSATSVANRGLEAHVVAPRQVVLAWGRGVEGQLGGSGCSDSASPRIVGGSLKGRQILQARSS